MTASSDPRNRRDRKDEFKGEGGGPTLPAVSSAPQPAPAPVHLDLPLDRDALSGLVAGQPVFLTGELFLLRDAGHQRLLAEIAERDAAGEGDGLPYGLDGATIFYAGPTPPGAGRPFAAVGPTTASRMDFAASELYRRGVVATLGKGVRSEEVRATCAERGCVYFTSVGGAASYLARCIVSAETIAYEDLGPEALRCAVVRDFPAFVAIDARGNSIFG